jgi:tol-pal system protein YbgF
MKKGLSGIVVFSLLAASLIGQDRSKKAYELIYEDIQVLKKQLVAIEEKIGETSAAIEALMTQVRELQVQVKSLQANQSAVQDGIKNVPSQYEYVLDKIDQINQLLAKMSEDLLTIKGGAPLQPAPGAEAKPAVPPTTEKKSREAKKEPAAPETKSVPPKSISLSPQEVYNTAYADYLKGSFELAVDGFRLYRENFPDSPLADNALYWIGECDYSQKKFPEAIDAFNDLILNYPQSDKIAAAYLKKGLALAELGKKDEALVVLRLLLSKYRLEEEARIAQEKIKELAAK